MASNKKDLCVIGIGRFGESIVEQLIELKRYVFAIDIKEVNLIKVSRITKTAIADAADIEALKSLGIAKFKTVIVATSNNIEIIAALIELGVVYIIAKANSIRHELVLRQIGVDVIIRPNAEAGIRTALIATNTNFIKYSKSLQEVGDGYVIGSSIINNVKWLKKPLRKLHFSKIGVFVISIKHGSKVYLPSGDTILQSGDIITIIGKIINITKIIGDLNIDLKTKVIKNIKMNSAIEKANYKRNKNLEE